MGKRDTLLFPPVTEGLTSGNPTSGRPAASFLRQPWRLLRQHLVICAFVFISGLDYLLTWLLIEHCSFATESNPVAGFVLIRFGWTGLFCFKVTLTLLPILLIWLIARHRPRSAQRVRCFALGSVTLVVAYSTVLLLCRSDVSGGSKNQNPRIASAKLVWEYQGRARSLSRELMAGEIELPQAVATLKEWSAKTDHQAIRHLECYLRGHTLDVKFAADLIRKAGESSSCDDELALLQLREFQEDFERISSVRLPEWARAYFVQGELRTRRKRNPNGYASSACFSLAPPREAPITFAQANGTEP